ncbi:MAG: MFS transporter, partial [Rhodospirillaceae bacterium]|nr:MFS transporter [Rhodospirillaceae bacterium]
SEGYKRQTLSYWLSRVGVDKTAIGLFALVGLPYSLKFAWAPLVDQLSLPVLTRRLGRRRSWILVTQAGLAAAILAMGAADPAARPLATAAAALAVAFFSASQDIVIDAYRIEVLAEHEQGAGAGATQLGYRIGLLVAGAGALALSDFIDWFWIFAMLAGLVVLSMAAVLAAPRPPEPALTAEDAARRAPDLPAALAAWLKGAVVAPFADFMRRPQWPLILAFALLYKFGDAIGGTMATPFYVEIGFTGVEVAGVTKVMGVAATMAGTLVGGAVVARYGLFLALLAGGVLQAATNLLYAAQAVMGHDLGFLALTIGADNFTGGLGSAAFVAYLSSLCTTGFSGTQYALLTSFMALGRTVLSSGSGWLADHMDWISFFALTTLLALPGLLLLILLMRRRPGAVARSEPAPLAR